MAEARAFLAKYGADEATQDRLIAEYLAGGRWDSMQSGSTPVSVRTSSASDGDYTIQTFPDGSIAVTRVEKPVVEPEGGISTQGISECSGSGSVRTDCKIDTWVGAVALSFRASYNLSTNTVTNVYGGGWSIAAACSAHQKYLGRPASNIGRLEVEATMCVVGYSQVFWLQLTLSGGSASVSWG
jgi:hypothetical protein